MNNLSFVPSIDPIVDYLVTTDTSNELREKMEHLGASVLTKFGYTAFVWDPTLGDSFVSGLGVVGGSFVRGPRTLSSRPDQLGVGNYSFVELTPDRATVTPDPFGMAVCYYSDSLVTNRLHLAMLASPEIDADNAVSCLYNDGGFSFSFNNFRTPVKNVRILPQGFKLKVERDGVSAHCSVANDQFEILSPDAYWELISAGASEIIDNATAVVDSGFPVFCDLTGGKDSRIVFGALIAAGKQKQVTFNTIPIPTSPGQKADLEIATGLVARYGGSYAGRRPPVGYSQFSVQQNLERRRSQLFGSYHWLTPSEVRPVKSLSKTPAIRMLGGGGELYRDYWRPMLFQDSDVSLIASDGNVEAMLRSRVRGSVAQKHFPRYLPDLLETFELLPGGTLNEKLDAHYLNFRNRFHFGMKQTVPESMESINIAMSSSLLRAARGLPEKERASGRVLFDVIRVLDEKLAYLPFDKPLDPAIFDSVYHSPGRFDGEDLRVDPRPDLVTDVKDLRKFHRPVIPSAAPLDFRNLLDSEIGHSLDVLSGNGSIFGDVLDKEFSEFIEWAKKYSDRNHSALASKLRSFADYQQLV